MSINWQDVLGNIGTTLVSSVVVVGAAAWVIRTLVSDRLARDADKFKIQLKADADSTIERLKNSLQMAALEHQVRFSNLHEKRAVVIAEVYQRLVEAERGGWRVVLVEGQHNNTQKQEEAKRDNDERMYEISFFIEKNRIYLPERICASLKSFLDTMSIHVIKVGVYGSIEYPTPDTLKERNKVLLEAYQAFEREIPAARRALEDEFRKILGGENSRSPDATT